MRLSRAVGTALVAACHPGAPATPAPEQCEAGVPATAKHPLAIPARDLAGEYQLIQVRTQPDAPARTVARLHLAPLDSVARAGSVGGAARDLVGWLETARGDSTWRPGAGSRDPAKPGVVLVGSHLRLGQPGAYDARVEHLTITAVGREGFWGWWRAEPGWEVPGGPAATDAPPDPAGYFCALRVGT